jgi:hypothetical protein
MRARYPCRRRPFPAQAGGPHRRARWETLRHNVIQDGATGRALIPAQKSDSRLRTESVGILPAAPAMLAARRAGNLFVKKRAPFGELKLCVSYIAGWFVFRLLTAAGQEPEPHQGAAEKRQLVRTKPKQASEGSGFATPSGSIGEASFLVVSFDPFELVARLTFGHLTRIIMTGLFFCDASAQEARCKPWLPAPPSEATVARCSGAGKWWRRRRPGKRVRRYRSSQSRRQAATSLRTGRA